MPSFPLNFAIYILIAHMSALPADSMFTVMKRGFMNSLRRCHLHIHAVNLTLYALLLTVQAVETDLGPKFELEDTYSTSYDAHSGASH